MKITKKLTTILFSIALMLSVCGCSSNLDEQTKRDSAQVVLPEEATVLGNIGHSVRIYSAAQTYTNELYFYNELLARIEALESKATLNVATNELIVNGERIKILSPALDYIVDMDNQD